MKETTQLCPSSYSRRRFCYGTGSLLLAYRTRLSAAPKTGTATRPDVAAVDHDRIMAAAALYLNQAPAPITSFPCSRNPGSIHDYYSEREAYPDDAPVSNPLFLAHRDAVFKLGLAVPALTSAYLLTRDKKYSDHAAQQIRTWFVSPDTRMSPSLDYARVLAQSTGSRPPVGHYSGILETLPLIEVAQSIPFLTVSGSLTDDESSTAKGWFAAYLGWLTQPRDSGPRLAALARDHKDHHATSWLLQASAYASLAIPVGDVARSEDDSLAMLRHHYKTVTLRSQLNADGMFKNELQSATPYRDSLFNLDMLAAVCQLLSTRFENLWDYQLQDGPGMRSAIAYHFPFIADPGVWPFRADAEHFNELPSRRPSLLLAARPYQRPEYAALWLKLPTDPPTPDILRTIPIHQPLLWVTEPHLTSAAS